MTNDGDAEEEEEDVAVSARVEDQNDRSEYFEEMLSQNEKKTK
jgi:hypothetical protein